MKKHSFTFIDLFAGIGGFHLALHSVGAKCVFSSEWDKYARLTYEENFKSISPGIFNEKLFAGDITKVSTNDIPEFDILTGGFPCQPFSQAGYKKGFADPRGTLFNDIVRILREKRPSAFFIENVRHLLKHDEGRTFAAIRNIILNELGYTFDYKVVKASEFGLPQHRPRLFMVGFDKKRFGKVHFKFPEPQEELKYTMSDVLGGKCDKQIGYTLRVGGRHSSIADRRNWDSYLVDGKVVTLTIDQAKKMMGLPDSFSFPVSETQTFKQLGNSVAVTAIAATAKEIVDKLQELSAKSE
ncbi:MAG: DNA cytosine methyltransferase [Candidatus Pacebacteria bacterium CG_4_10_14_0_8_um_filter_42_14]|nr:MAG: DNA cytosine methyltransferase [Candidatus Pacebacteria bacterium CG_4_10_14_0_8_um_filter_42_14]